VHAPVSVSLISGAVAGSSSVLVWWYACGQLWHVQDVSSIIHPVLDDSRVYTVEANLALLDVSKALTARSLVNGAVVREVLRSVCSPRASSRPLAV
jgi:hypothetical protein